jgi:uncharacterized protein (TIGR02687 family)
VNTETIRDNLVALFMHSRRWEHEGRRVVFWYDDGGEFRQDFESLDLDGIRKHLLNGNPFRSKILIESIGPDEKLLVYSPWPKPAPREDWLLDALKYGQEFSADRAAMIALDLGFTDPAVVATIRERVAFFDSKRRVEALKGMSLPASISAPELAVAMMSVTVGLKAPDPRGVIRKVLVGGLDESQNAAWKDLVKFFNAEAFWALCRAQLGYEETPGSDFKPSLRRLFLKLAVTHMHQGFRGRFPEHLESFVISPGHAAYGFANEWMNHQGESPVWDVLAGDAANDLRILEVAEDLEPNHYRDSDTFQEFDKEIVRRIVASLRGQGEDYAHLRALIEARRPLHWYRSLEPIYEALSAAIDLFDYHTRFKHRFTGLNTGELFDLYATELYRVDTAYRHFVAASDKVTLGDILKPLAEDVERLYLNWFLEEVGSTWSQALESATTDDWSVPGIPAQQRFFARYVEPILRRNDREKVFVIVSDALRYEVATELSETLARELRGEVTVAAQLGVLPSITKLGMAALLPHQGKAPLSLTEKGEVLLDGRSTSGIEARKAILEANDKGSTGTALKAHELLDAAVARGREMVQPYRVVYVYHDTIDAAGDRPASERGVFGACAKAIEELVALIQRVTASLNGTNVVVTSDHGFLYQRSRLEGTDKLQTPADRKQIVESNRRYLIGRGFPEATGTIGVSMRYLMDDTDLSVLSPRGGMRFAVQGGGANFVHGGASLQEVVVPVLTYKHARAVKGEEGPNRKVGVQTIARARKVTNNKFTIRVLQADPVQAKVAPRRVRIGLYDLEGTGGAITDERLVELNSNSFNASEREQSIRLTISVHDPDRHKLYYLVIRDADDGTEVLREPWTVNLGITNDFGDFGL